MVDLAFKEQRSRAPLREMYKRKHSSSRPIRGGFSLIWFRFVFDWALFRTINVDQRGGKTESERCQRLLAMTISTGYVGSTLINVYGFEQGPVEHEAKPNQKENPPQIPLVIDLTASLTR